MAYTARRRRRPRPSKRSPVLPITPTAADHLRANVLALLGEQHRTKRALAAALGVHPTTISKFVKGERELQFHHLDALALFFALDVPRLFVPQPERLLHADAA